MNKHDETLFHIYTSIFERFHDPSRRAMTLEEFRAMCRIYFPDARDSDIEMTFERVDRDRSGMIELPEFLRVARQLFIDAPDDEATGG